MEMHGQARLRAFVDVMWKEEVKAGESWAAGIGEKRFNVKWTKAGHSTHSTPSLRRFRW